MTNTPFTAEAVFGMANAAAMLGWVALAAGILLRNPLLRDQIAGLAVPLALSALYAAIVGIHIWSAEGGFDSLASVALLFGSEWVLLGGWVHYLAYDLFVGAWIARDADRRGAPRWLPASVLPLAFLFAPAGFLLWIMIRTALPNRIRGSGASRATEGPAA